MVDYEILNRKVCAWTSCLKKDIGKGTFFLFWPTIKHKLFFGVFFFFFGIYSIFTKGIKLFGWKLRLIGFAFMCVGIGWDSIWEPHRQSQQDSLFMCAST